MNQLLIKIKKLHKDAKLPSYAHPGDAGLDLYCCENVSLRPGERKAIRTGIAIQLPRGYAGLIWDKSGLAIKDGLSTLGGVFEHTYRGEYLIIMLNTSKKTYYFKKGDKIAQLLIQPISECKVREVNNLSKTKRGAKRFGSSGK